MWGYRKKSLEGIKRKKQQTKEGDSDAEDPGMQEDQNADGPSDDDTDYYRQAVGEEPDEGQCLNLGGCVQVGLQ